MKVAWSPWQAQGVDRATVAVYEAEAGRWERERRARDLAEARDLRARATGRVLDLGCGPGWHLPTLAPAVGVDASVAMARRAAARGPVVVGDAAALGLRDRSFGGVWASRSVVHVPPGDTPMALAEIHRVTTPGSPVTLVVFTTDGTAPVHGPWPDDDFPGRRFTRWPPSMFVDLVVGAGMRPTSVVADPPGHLVVRAVREESLADTVRPGMRLLVCGFNPSVHAARVGVGYAGPGNRFWPAAEAAGLVPPGRDPRAALAAGVGMTDLCKRATPAAAALGPDELREGAARLERLVRWLRPGAVCFVGLGGYRVAVDRRARPGPQPRRFGGVPCWVMPSTSGRNARTPLSELVDHLRGAAALGSGSPAPEGLSP